MFFVSFVFGFHGAYAADAQPALASLAWIQAPTWAEIANKAHIELIGDLVFLYPEEKKKFLVATGNLPRDNQNILASKKTGWFAIFHYVDDGHVKDDEKIDPDALFAALEKGNAKEIEQREQQSLPPLYLSGSGRPYQDDECRQAGRCRFDPANGGTKEAYGGRLLYAIYAVRLIDFKTRKTVWRANVDFYRGAFVIPINGRGEALAVDMSNKPKEDHIFRGGRNQETQRPGHANEVVPDSNLAENGVKAQVIAPDAVRTSFLIDH